MAAERNTVVIGSGFSGLSAAAWLAAEGHEVHVLEKNEEPGGRARRLFDSGFVFDMGPSWYWMPEVYEQHFNRFQSSATDYYQLRQLDPAFSVIFGKEDVVDVPADPEAMKNTFEKIEPGSAKQFDRFMKEAAIKYEIGFKRFAVLPSLKVREFLRADLFISALRLQLFTSFSRHVRRYFRHPKLLAIMEFPILFLGALPGNTPAMYSMMNYAGLQLGTWYPMGGYGEVVRGLKLTAEKAGAQFHFNEEVTGLSVNNGRIDTIKSTGLSLKPAAVIASADYHHVEADLLPEDSRSYSSSYWESRVLAPSCLLFFLGVDKKIGALRHHNLFFDENFRQHAEEIYENPAWPAKPQFYVCCPSRTDASVAPPGKENLFILMPIAAGLMDSAEKREAYYQVIMDRLEAFAGEPVRQHVIVKRSYCVDDFITDYHAFKGNAYGLANTLFQTALFKPKMKSRKVQNLFYAGQLTVPGPGVPPALVSGRLAAQECHKYLLNLNPHEIVV